MHICDHPTAAVNNHNSAECTATANPAHEHLPHQRISYAKRVQTCYRTQRIHSVLTVTMSASRSDLLDMKIDDLKRMASRMKIEPDGDKRQKDTWITAILECERRKATVKSQGISATTVVASKFTNSPTPHHLNDMKIDELKQMASRLEVIPDGDKRYRNTWVAAILKYYEDRSCLLEGTPERSRLSMPKDRGPGLNAARKLMLDHHSTDDSSIAGRIASFGASKALMLTSVHKGDVTAELLKQGARMPKCLPLICTSFAGADLAAKSDPRSKAGGDPWSVCDYLRDSLKWPSDAVFIDASNLEHTPMNLVLMWTLWWNPSTMTAPIGSAMRSKQTGTCPRSTALWRCVACMQPGLLIFDEIAAASLQTKLQVWSLPMGTARLVCYVVLHQQGVEWLSGLHRRDR